jgi:DNA-binding protein H-NS
MSTKYQFDNSRLLRGTVAPQASEIGYSRLRYRQGVIAREKRGRVAIHGKRKGKSLKGRKVAPKYRDKAGNQWAGRGAQPVWLREVIGKGAKPEDFLISKMARKAAAKPAKKTGRKKKAG